jgi:hypothetical protein
MQSTRYSRQILMKLEFSRKIFEKFLNIKFYENPPSWSRVIPRGRTDGRTKNRRDIRKLIVTFHNFANAPKGGFVASKNKGIWNQFVKKKPEQWTASGKRDFRNYRKLSHWVMRTKLLTL